MTKWTTHLSRLSQSKGSQNELKGKKRNCHDKEEILAPLSCLVHSVNLLVTDCTTSRAISDGCKESGQFKHHTNTTHVSFAGTKTSQLLFKKKNETRH